MLCDKNILVSATLMFCFSFTSRAQTTQNQLVETYITRARIEAQINSNLETADSLSQLAVKQAESTLDSDLHYRSIMAYLQRDFYGNPNEPVDKLIQHGFDLEENITDSNKKFHLWIALANRICFDEVYLSRADNLSQRAFSHAASSDDIEIKAKAFLTSSTIALMSGRIKDAYRNLLNAQNMIALLGSDKARLYNEILLRKRYNFYDHIDQDVKALSVSQELVDLVNSTPPIDSTKLMWAHLDLCLAATSEKPDFDISERITSVISYANRSKNQMLAYYANSFYRTFLINNLHLDKIFSIYGDYYTIDNDTITVSYCLNNALFCEYKNNIDSAIVFFEQAISLAKDETNILKKSNLYRRFGQFLERHGKNKEAFHQFKTAAQLVKNHPNADYVLDDVIPALDTLAFQHGDINQALEYSSWYVNVLKEKSNQQIDASLLIMELENERNQNVINTEREILEYKRKRNIQYFAIGVALILLFLIFVIVSSLTVPNWLIKMLGFFSILFIFEFIILILDNTIHEWAHGENIQIFLVKIAILSVLYPLHHVIEHSVTSYMVKNQLIKRPTPNVIREWINKLYPWMAKSNDGDH